MQNVSGELIVSGLDSATSLIQAAKNLMNAVVVTVKSSYVASTKYPRQAIAEGIVQKPIVVWKMKVCKPIWPIFWPCNLPLFGERWLLYQSIFTLLLTLKQCAKSLTSTKDHYSQLFKGGFFSESAMCFLDLQIKKKNIEKNYPELKI